MPVVEVVEEKEREVGVRSDRNNGLIRVLERSLARALRTIN